LADPADSAAELAANAMMSADTAPNSEPVDVKSKLVDANSGFVDANPKPPLESAGHYYVVSNSNGFVAAYYTMSMVREKLLKRFSLTPFIVQKFAVADGAVDTIWVVLFSSNDAVAFVSNSRDEAERVRAGYARIGLTYEDPIDHWECKVGVIAESSLKLLEATDRAHQMYAGPAVDEEDNKRERAEIERLDRLLVPDPDGPLARLVREEERITIFDGVIDLVTEPMSEGEAVIGATIANAADVAAA
jgi:hypothetical protein